MFLTTDPTERDSTDRTVKFCHRTAAHIVEHRIGAYGHLGQRRKVLYDVERSVIPLFTWSLNSDVFCHLARKHDAEKCSKFVIENMTQK